MVDTVAAQSSDLGWSLPCHVNNDTLKQMALVTVVDSNWGCFQHSQFCSFGAVAGVVVDSQVPLLPHEAAV